MQATEEQMLNKVNVPGTSLTEHIFRSVIFVSVWFVLTATTSEQDGLPPMIFFAND